MIIISNDDRYEFGSLEVTRREGEEWGWDAQLEVAERKFLLKDNFFARQFFCNNSTIHIRIETLMIITVTTVTMLVDKHHLHRLHVEHSGGVVEAGDHHHVIGREQSRRKGKSRRTWYLIKNSSLSQQQNIFW